MKAIGVLSVPTGNDMQGTKWGESMGIKHSVILNTNHSRQFITLREKA